NEQRIYRERGWQPDSFIAQQFKRKVMAGEIIGFSASPNTYAMELVLLGGIAAGLAAQRIADRDEWGWATVIIISLAPAIVMLWYTECRAAFVTPIFAAGIVAALALHVGGRRRRTWFWGIVLIIAIGVAGLIGFGLSHGSLVHDSLTFRWWYWIGSMRIVAKHPLLGVGFANFADHYLAVRLPVASEEIRDPHNFFIRILSETGIIGAALLVAWMMRMAWEQTAPPRPRKPGPPLPHSPLTLLFFLAIGVIVLNIAVSVDFSQSVAYISIEILKRIMWGGLLLIGQVVGTLKLSEDQINDSRPAPWIRWAILGSLAAFVLHNTIEFGFFESGPLGLFALLCGALLGVSSDGAERNGNWAISIAAIIGWLAAAFFWVFPIVRGEGFAQEGDDVLQSNRADGAVQNYRDAIATLPVADAPLLLRTATAQMYAGAMPSEVLGTLDRTTIADPNFIRGYLTRAEYELRFSTPDLERVRQDYERAIALNPNDVAVRTDYAGLLERMGDSGGALREYDAALAANAGLSKDEPKRLSAKQVDDLNDRVKRLQALQR
ncbi:MAG: O-antigen ligase family protein, partial [Phycisphaerae bacterium]|nr:O-antigen ligase family protein [Phycisphaerae bacterium]